MRDARAQQQEQSLREREEQRQSVRDARPPDFFATEISPSHLSALARSFFAFCVSSAVERSVCSRSSPAIELPPRVAERAGDGGGCSIPATAAPAGGSRVPTAGRSPAGWSALPP